MASASIAPIVLHHHTQTLRIIERRKTNSIQQKSHKNADSRSSNIDFSNTNSSQINHFLNCYPKFHHLKLLNQPFDESLRVDTLKERRIEEKNLRFSRTADAHEYDRHSLKSDKTKSELNEEMKLKNRIEWNTVRLRIMRVHLPESRDR